MTLEEPRVRRLALATTLLRKGRFADERAEASRAISPGLPVEERDTFEQWRALRTKLASLSSAGPGTLAPEEYQRQLKELKEQADALEILLARRSAVQRAPKDVPSPEQVVDRVASALPEDGVLVEFIAYQDTPLVPKPGAPAREAPGEPRYLALLLFAGGRTAAVDLGPAAPLEQAIQRLREAFATGARERRPAVHAVYQLAFRPLLPALGRARRLFLAPDGELARVPFEALNDGRRPLTESFEFTYLTSGTGVLPRSERTTPSGSGR